MSNVYSTERTKSNILLVLYFIFMLNILRLFHISNYKCIFIYSNNRILFKKKNKLVANIKF